MESLEHDKKEYVRRRLTEFALEVGRKGQNSKTGFIHYCYEDPEEEGTIPLWENFCFVLALFCSRLIENSTEAKSLLEKLLPFYHEGNFPVYLHAYPRCEDPLLGVNLLPIFQRLLGVLSSSLRDKLLEVVEGIVRSAQALTLPSFAQAKLQAWMSGEFVWTKTLQNPLEWGEYLLTLQMSRACQEEHVAKAASYWHPRLLCYVGPSNRLLYHKSQPAVTLYDFFLSLFTGELSPRLSPSIIRQEDFCRADLPVYLQGVLPVLSGAVLREASPWEWVFQPEENHSLQLLWGSSQHIHSVVVLRKKCSIKGEVTAKKAELFLQLPDLGEKGKGEGGKKEEEEGVEEFSLYCDRGLQLEVDGKRATLFSLPVSFVISSDRLRVACVLTVEEGGGHFWGHIALGNRPGNGTIRPQRGGSTFEKGWDWHIGIRAARRSSRCTLKLTLTVQE